MSKLRTTKRCAGDDDAFVENDNENVQKIEFRIANGEEQEIVVLSLFADGMIYRGELVTDGGKVYEAFMEWLKKVDATGASDVHRGLTLATLADMLLGEDAKDRSDDALIRRARELISEKKYCPSCTRKTDVELENGICPQCGTNE